MGFSMSRQRYRPVDLPAWRKLVSHNAAVAGTRIEDLFSDDPERFHRLSFAAGDLFVDFSKNRITDETLRGLITLAREAGVETWIEKLFDGDLVNTTEQRPALHWAARDLNHTGTQETVRRFREFGVQLQNRPGSGITDVINLGIGGSHLGVAMAADALSAYRTEGRRVHFVAGSDGVALGRLLDRLQPENTLAIVCSKSFTTAETLSNARIVRDWFVSVGSGALGEHLAGVSAHPERMAGFGIPESAQFPMSEGIGGRYSVWSTAGLALALAIGVDRFEEMLSGARVIDRHFRDTAFEQNLPVIFGLLEVWNVSFFGTRARAVVPYDERLLQLPHYLQQLVMESNGKGVTRDGEPVEWPTGPVVFGGVGPAVQHSFFQLLHQGPETIPVEFLIPRDAIANHDSEHRAVVAAALAQSRALMTGRRDPTAPYRDEPGNRPSTTILYPRLDPGTLGQLLALYEHQTFVAAVVWGINPFDQFGVELGKQVAGDLERLLAGDGKAGELDASTLGLASLLSRTDRDD